MKKTLLALMIIVCGNLAVFSQNYKTAIGIRLSSSDPVVNNSVSFKHFLNTTSAVEALFTFDNRKVAIGALYELHRDISSAEGLTWFYGGGAYLGFDDNKDNPTRNLMGAQGIVGLDYKFPYIPINLAIDWKPELNIIDNINFEPASIGLTVRFTFGKQQPS